MHLPGAAQPGVKHHQITDPKTHRLPTIGGDGDITLQQQAGLLLVVGPGKGADPTAPGGLAGHAQALQLRWIRFGGDRDAAGHGCLNENQGPLSAPSPADASGTQRPVLHTPLGWGEQKGLGIDAMHLAINSLHAATGEINQ